MYPDKLSIADRKKLAGKWIALEIYTPKTTPERRIEAVGSSPASCAQQLSQRGLNPAQFEYVVMKAAF
jgi:hypothetical protein